MIIRGLWKSPSISLNFSRKVQLRVFLQIRSPKIFEFCFASSNSNPLGYKPNQYWSPKVANQINPIFLFACLFLGGVFFSRILPQGSNKPWNSPPFGRHIFGTTEAAANLGKISPTPSSSKGVESMCSPQDWVGKVEKEAARDPRDQKWKIWLIWRFFFFWGGQILYVFFFCGGGGG